MDILPRKKHPVIFHGVSGLEEQDENSPSTFNLNEVDQVVWYISKIIDEANSKKLNFTLKDIGVVTPYKKQVQKLMTAFGAKGWNDIMVGSVDIFQGSEKLIIIISTVRSSNILRDKRTPVVIGKNRRELGFINDPKRFNVALTRAKALLIVIGDPEVLACQSHWKLLMDHCLNFGSYRGLIAESYLSKHVLVKVKQLAKNEESDRKSRKTKEKAKKEIDKLSQQLETNLKIRGNDRSGDKDEKEEQRSVSVCRKNDHSIQKETTLESSKEVSDSKLSEKDFRNEILDVDIESFL